MRPGCPFKQQGTNFVFVKEKLFEKNVHFALLCECFQFLSLISDGDGSPFKQQLNKGTDFDFVKEKLFEKKTFILLCFVNVFNSYL